MSDENKTKKYLIDELVQLRQRVTDLVTFEKEYNRTKEALNENIEQYQIITETLQIGTCIIQDGKCVYMNNTAKKITGLSHPQKPGYLTDAFDKIIHPKDKSFVMEYMNIIEEGALPISPRFTYRLNTNSDETKWIEQHTIAISHNGKPAILMVNKDVTERKNTEEALNITNEKFSKAFYSAPIMLSLTKIEDDQYIEINETFEHITGYIREEVLGRTLLNLDLFTLEELDRLKQLLSDNCVVYNEPFNIKRKSGEAANILLSSQVMEIKDELFLISSAVDITERKQLYNQLEEKTRELEDFVYTVSHDLKAPLVSLEGFSSILINEHQEKLSDKGVHYLKRIQHNVNNMKSLISDLLDLSRIGRLVGQMESIDIETIIIKVIEDLKFIIEANNINISIAAPLPNPYGDGDRIKQVFENLISNAIKFMGDQKKPKIEIGNINNEDDVYTFYVKDNGIGINKKYQEKIFQIFQRLNDIETEGTGVGLTIVKRIIAHHGGRLWLDSENGKGSAFYFTLPTQEV